LDAGIKGTDRDPWRACDVINFRLDAPQECLDAGIDGTGRNDWQKCDVIMFELEAPQVCLDAGIRGTDRDPWKECEEIRFEHEAPQECLDAGIKGTDRRAWDKCNEITENINECDQCNDICGHNQWECSNGKCGCYEYNECKDGCRDECGDENSECRDNKCVCTGYGENGPPGSGEGGSNTCDYCGEKCEGKRWECNNNACECFDDHQGEPGTDSCATILCQDGYDCRDGECVYMGEPEIRACEDGCDIECGINVGWDCGSEGECICHQEPIETDPCANTFCPDDHYCDNGECIYDGPEPVVDVCDQCAEKCGGARWECGSDGCVCFEGE
tara:strand:+ start:209 stop:1198 length:990 start_codon:yes stop_codon:yes gene_type:complete